MTLPIWLWRPVAAASLYAAVELGLGILLGDFFPAGRAEAGIFHLLRPGLLLILAPFVSFWDWRMRAVFYPSALLAAALAEGLFLSGIGAPNPWPELAWGWGAGLLFALLFDSLCLVGRDVLGRWGVIAGVVAGVVFMLATGLTIYEGIVVDKGPPASAARDADKPGLAVMTALPVIWGESDRLLDAKPSRTYAVLRGEYEVKPLDTLDESALKGARLLLLAQPRRLASAELAALDAWVRGGGRALILTDPMLVWPSRLPPGDARRAPPVGLLGPLLDHWGLRLEDGERGQAVRFIGGRKLAVAAPGRFESANSACRVGDAGLVARCGVGRGGAFVVADADLMHDALWIEPELEGGDRRDLRTADNPLVVADWIDELAGVTRQRGGGDVAWTSPQANRDRAFLLAALPILLAAVAGLALRFRRAS
ncbi:Gldg family protein [Allosphingosinicella flava]|uniref:Gldg family protein n=1 Tax=Allosphingosinicella flava TaxID=2771430 RepID=A0A7T2GHN5_9SPHN|nr:Gldg family protein [Sphingosinicella flava]QPQ54065.1 Gldg family protein [Sphingosinicella flava]